MQHIGLVSLPAFWTQPGLQNCFPLGYFPLTAVREASHQHCRFFTASSRAVQEEGVNDHLTSSIGVIGAFNFCQRSLVGSNYFWPPIRFFLILYCPPQELSFHPLLSSISQRALGGKGTDTINSFQILKKIAAGITSAPKAFVSKAYRICSHPPRAQISRANRIAIAVVSSCKT